MSALFLLALFGARLGFSFQSGALLGELPFLFLKFLAFGLGAGFSFGLRLGALAFLFSAGLGLGFYLGALLSEFAFLFLESLAFGLGACLRLGFFFGLLLC